MAKFREEKLKKAPCIKSTSVDRLERGMEGEQEDGARGGSEEFVQTAAVVLPESEVLKCEISQREKRGHL